MRLRGDCCWKGLAATVLVQTGAGILGVWAAHAMFDLPAYIGARLGDLLIWQARVGEDGALELLEVQPPGGAPYPATAITWHAANAPLAGRAVTGSADRTASGPRPGPASRALSSKTPRQATPIRVRGGTEEGGPPARAREGPQDPHRSRPR